MTVKARKTDSILRTNGIESNYESKVSSTDECDGVVCRVNSNKSENQNKNKSYFHVPAKKGNSVVKLSNKQKAKIFTKNDQVKTNKQNKQTSTNDDICLKVWNIFGLKQPKINKIKNKTDKFLNDIFETSDFVVFTETWSEKGDPDLFGWDEDYEEIIRECGQRKSKRGRSSGGISFCARRKFAHDYQILASDSYRIWLKINKSLFNGEEDIIICILYIPPSCSNWFKSGKSFNPILDGGGGKFAPSWFFEYSSETVRSRKLKLCDF